jgi:hypothetical protein
MISFAWCAAAMVLFSMYVGVLHSTEQSASNLDVDQQMLNLWETPCWDTNNFNLTLTFFFVL